MISQFKINKSARTAEIDGGRDPTTWKTAALFSVYFIVEEMNECGKRKYEKKTIDQDSLVLDALTRCVIRSGPKCEPLISYHVRHE